VGRPGRLSAGERERRHEEVLDAAVAVLIDGGYAGLTMQRVAAQAGASKETFYAWFGSREGLLRALIERNADLSAARVQAALQESDGDSPAETLTAYAIGLLRLLSGPQSVALNRAAMASPTLAALLLSSGRYRIGPLVEEYLRRLDAEGRLAVPDPAESFRLLYGLVVRDSQILVLLGENAPTTQQITAQAKHGVDNFLVLLSTDTYDGPANRLTNTSSMPGQNQDVRTSPTT